MAIGTVTVDEKIDAQGPVFFTRVHFVGPASYTANGDTGLLAAIKAHYKNTQKIIGIIPQDCGGYAPTYFPATDKVKVYRQDGTAGAPAPAPEVAAAVDLSGVTFNILVISY